MGNKVQILSRILIQGIRTASFLDSRIKNLFVYIALVFFYLLLNKAGKMHKT